MNDDKFGYECKSSSHEVKTLEKAQEWYSKVTVDDLPITVDQRTTVVGRVFARIYNKDGKLLGTRG